MTPQVHLRRMSRTFPKGLVSTTYNMLRIITNILKVGYYEYKTRKVKFIPYAYRQYRVCGGIEETFMYAAFVICIVHLSRYYMQARTRTNTKKLIACKLTKY